MSRNRLNHCPDGPFPEHVENPKFVNVLVFSQLIQRSMCQKFSRRKPKHCLTWLRPLTDINSGANFTRFAIFATTSFRAACCRCRRRRPRRGDSCGSRNRASPPPSATSSSAAAAIATATCFSPSCSPSTWGPQMTCPRCPPSPDHPAMSSMYSIFR